MSKEKELLDKSIKEMAKAVRRQVKTKEEIKKAPTAKKVMAGGVQIATKI